MRKLYWFLVVPLYCYAAFHFLWSWGPPFGDGEGIQATFHWGRNLPSASWRDYYGDWHVRFRFVVQYWVAATIITLLGCGVTGSVVRRFALLSSHPFTASAGVALLLMVLAPAVSDSGRAWGLFQTGYFCCSVDTIRLLLFVALPMSVLSGFIALGWKLLYRGRPALAD